MMMVFAGAYAAGLAPEEAVAMNAPFYKFGAFGDEVSLVVAFLIGIGFGFFLERAGFGSARKLTAQFYLDDLAVFKVMFTAIVTAMLGLFYLSWLGFVDLSLVYLSAHLPLAADRRRAAARRRLRRRRLLPRHLAGGGGHRPARRRWSSCSASSSASSPSARPSRWSKGFFASGGIGTADAAAGARTCPTAWSCCSSC